jgi:hypothetical protein
MVQISISRDSSAQTESTKLALTKANRPGKINNVTEIRD